MKNIKTIILLLIFGCQINKKTENNLLKIKVIDNDMKQYTKSVYWYYNNQIFHYQKFAKVRVVNESEDMYILASTRRLFPLLKCLGDRGGHLITHPDPENFSKIYIKKNDSTTIYVAYVNECDTVLVNLFWKRDSLELDELKFYKTKEGEIKYHSSKKKATGNKLNEEYQRYKDKSLLPEEEGKTTSNVIK